MTSPLHNRAHPLDNFEKYSYYLVKVSKPLETLNVRTTDDWNIKHKAKSSRFSGHYFALVDPHMDIFKYKLAGDKVGLFSLDCIIKAGVQMDCTEDGHDAVMSLREHQELLVCRLHPSLRVRIRYTTYE